MDKKIDNSELDIVEVIINLWNNKFKIVFITSLFISIALFNQLYPFSQKKPNPRIKTITEIIPISIDDEVKYDTYNYFITKNQNTNIELNRSLNSKNLDFIKSNGGFRGKKIDKSYLLDLFVDTIRGDEFLSSIIKKSKLIKKDDYTNDEEYENIVNQLVKSIRLIPPVYDEKNDKQLSGWKIQFLANDINNWKNFLKILNDSTNIQVQSIVRNNFKDYINSKIKIHQYKIEDLETEISNTLIKYKEETLRRIIFLTEQAAIARELEIAKASYVTGSLESQSFATDTGIITNLKTETPYYMRGYEMIEKEIALIKERKDPQSFNERLINLKFQKNILMQDKEIERIQNIFQDTPIMKSDKFYAAKIIFEKIKYNDNNNLKENTNRSIYLAGIIGLIFGILYVMISMEIQKRNKTPKKINT